MTSDTTGPVASDEHKDPPIGRVGRTVMTFVSAIAASWAAMITGLVVTPFLLDALGAEAYGAFRAASEWLGHLRLMDLGLAGALAPLLADAVARGRECEVRQILITGARAYAGVAVAALVVGGTLALSMPALVPVAAEAETDLRLGCFIAALGAILFPLAPAQLLADAEQRGYWTQLLLLIQSPITMGLALWLAVAGHGITGQMFAVTVGAAVPPIVLAVWASVRTPGLLRNVLSGSPHSEVRARLRRLSGAAFFVQLCGRLSWFTDQGIVGLMLGPAAVVPLFITQRLAGLAQLQLQSVGNASWAALAELAARGEHRRFNERLIELTRITSILGAAALGPICAWNEAFVGLWVGPERFGGWDLTAVAALNAQLAAVQSLWGWALSGTGRLRAMVPILGVASAINLSASIALTLSLGIIGPLLGTTISLVLWSAWILPVTLRREFETSLSRLLFAVVGPTVLGSLVAIACAAWLRANPKPSWVRLLSEMSVAGLLTLGLCWFLVVPREERVLWRNRVFALVHRARAQ